MKGLVRVAIAAAFVVGLFSFGAAPALATQVSCGQVITQDTTLDNDLTDCPGDGIVIGADKITLDLNGHTIDGLSCTEDHPETCVHQDGIDNSGGYDRIRIRNGTITTFENGVLIEDAKRNELRSLHIVPFRGYGVLDTAGIHFSRSERNRVFDTNVSGADPAILLSESDRNTIKDSALDGGVVEHAGDGVDLLDGSDDNRVINSAMGGDGWGFVIERSRDNLLKGNRAGGHFGNELRSAERNVIVENTLPGGSTTVPLTLRDSNDNLIRNNTVSPPPYSGSSLGIGVDSGDRNIVESNQVGPIDGASIHVQGSDNLVRRNAVPTAGFYGITVSGAGNVVQSNSVTGSYIGFAVAAGSTATVIEDNLATNAYDDGIHVDAPGTLIRKNVANDNGDFGIEAVEGVIDGGGNTASGNGNPLQCLNVFCR
jgi:nitrous oxidase accessory protein NosD